MLHKKVAGGECRARNEKNKKRDREKKVVRKRKVRRKEMRHREREREREKERERERLCVTVCGRGGESNRCPPLTKKNQYVVDRFKCVLFFTRH